MKGTVCLIQVSPEGICEYANETHRFPTFTRYISWVSYWLKVRLPSHWSQVACAVIDGLTCQEATVEFSRPMAPERTIYSFGLEFCGPETIAAASLVGFASFASDTSAMANNRERVSINVSKHKWSRCVMVLTHFAAGAHGRPCRASYRIEECRWRGLGPCRPSQ